MKNIKRQSLIKFHFILNFKLLRRHLYLVKPTLYVISKKARIEVQQKMFFNLNWFDKFNGHNNRNGLLVIENNATLLVGDFVAYWGSIIHVAQNAVLKIESGYMNTNAVIKCHRSITIGKNVMIGDNVEIRDTDNHSIDRADYQESKPIVIDDNVWIGMRSVILKGVHLGKGCTIAAGSVVTKDVPPYCLAAGVPAKIIRETHHM